MKLCVGTSGYSYKEWKGSFYPDDVAAGDMLRFYATKLPAVEINNTFYRLPRTGVLETWADQVPDDFRFAIKASRRITHLKRLKGVEEETNYLLDTLRTLGNRLGVVADRRQLRGLRCSLLQEFVDAGDQRLRLEGLGDVATRAHLHGPVFVEGLEGPRQQQHRNVTERWILLDGRSPEEPDDRTE